MIDVVNAIALSNDGKYLYSASKDRSLRKFYLVKFEEVKHVKDIHTGNTIQFLIF